MMVHLTKVRNLTEALNQLRSSMNTEVRNGTDVVISMVYKQLELVDSSS